MNADERLITLIEKYLLGNCTSDEKEEVEQWYEQIADHQQSYYNDDKEKISHAAIASFDEIRSRLWKKENDRKLSPKIMTIRHWYAAAAIVLVMLVSGLYFFRQYSSTVDVTNKDQLTQSGANIKPGSNQAVLTLANGTQIVLNETKNGKIADQAGIKITKTADGRLIYTLSKMQPSSDGRPLYNTITTPKGGQYQVVLPDGTRIWLNAASSLRYPAMFDPAYRKIELSGEGYFQVAKATNKKGEHIPFIVRTDKQQVEVLGTQFNVNAYEDEKATVTTLFEGSVRVLAGKQSALIIPGEHAVLNGTTLHTGPADMEGALAWKNGFFFFKNADIKTVMRQLSRWYNVDVDYEGAVPLKKFSGEIYRNASITQVFDLLSYYKVNYRIESNKNGENKIIIMP